MNQEQLGDHGKEIIERIETPHPIRYATTFMEMAAMAMERGDGLDMIEKLMDLQDRHEQKEAKKAYVKAMAEFKQTAPKILKDAHVKYSTAKGVTEYDHSTLGAVVEAVASQLGKFGLSHTWLLKQDEGSITVTCEMKHTDGHSESVSLSGPEDPSGGKNAIQAIGSSVTYLERYTLLALLGLSTHGQDDDGVSSTEEPINAAQIKTIKLLIKEKKVEESLFLDYMGVKNAKDIKSSDFKKAITALNKAKGADPDA